MRRRELLIPVFLIALTVQILAPIATSWTAAIAASDPVGVAEICHGIPAELPASDDQGAGHRAHDALCSICFAAQTGAALGAPQQFAIAIPHREPYRVVWRDSASEIATARTGSNAQARAPPQLA